MKSPMCQSCAMPMSEATLFGTEANGEQREDYCIYCYEDGTFTSDVTMDGMIEQCAQFVDEYNKHAEQKVTQEQYIANMQKYFPQLKRWSK